MDTLVNMFSCEASDFTIAQSYITKTQTEKIKTKKE